MEHDFHKEIPPTLAQIAEADNVDITSVPVVHTELEVGLDIGSATTPAPLGNAEVATGHAVQSQGHYLTQHYEQFFKVAREAQADRSKRPQELLNDGGFKELLVWASENMGQIKEEGLQNVCFAAKPFPQLLCDEDVMFLTITDQKTQVKYNSGSWTGNDYFPVPNYTSAGKEQVVVLYKKGWRCEGNPHAPGPAHAQDTSCAGKGHWAREVRRFTLAFADDDPSTLDLRGLSHLTHTGGHEKQYTCVSFPKVTKRFRLYIDTPSLWTVTARQPLRASVVTAVTGPGGDVGGRSKRARTSLSGAGLAGASSLSVSGGGALPMDDAGIQLQYQPQHEPQPGGMLQLHDSQPLQPQPGGMLTAPQHAAIAAAAAAAAAAAGTGYPHASLNAGHPHAVQLHAVGTDLIGPDASDEPQAPDELDVWWETDACHQPGAALAVSVDGHHALNLLGMPGHLHHAGSASGVGGAQDDLSQALPNAAMQLWKALWEAVYPQQFAVLLHQFGTRAVLQAIQPCNGENILHALCTPRSLLCWRQGLGLGAAGRNTARGAYHSVIRSELGAGAGAGADLVADAAAQQLEQLGYQQGDEEERVVALMQVLKACVGPAGWQQLLAGCSWDRTAAGLPWWRETPLHKAARHGSRLRVLTLLLQDCDLLVLLKQTNHAWLAYHTAARCGHREAVKFLIASLRDRCRLLPGGDRMYPHGCHVLYQLRNVYYMRSGGDTILKEVCDELGLSAWLQPAYDKKRLLEALHTLAGRLQAMAASPPAVLQQRGTLSVQQQGVEQQSHQRLHGLQQHGLQQHGLQQQAQLLDVPMGQLGLQQAGSFPEPQMYLQPLAGPARDLLAGATAATEVQAGPSGSGPYRQQDPLLLPQLHVMPPLPQQQPLLYDEPLLQEEFQVEEGIILDFSAGQDSNM